MARLKKYLGLATVVTLALGSLACSTHRLHRAVFDNETQREVRVVLHFEDEYGQQSLTLNLSPDVRSETKSGENKGADVSDANGWEWDPDQDPSSKIDPGLTRATIYHGDECSLTLEPDELVKWSDHPGTNLSIDLTEERLTCD